MSGAASPSSALVPITPAGLAPVRLWGRTLLTSDADARVTKLRTKRRAPHRSRLASAGAGNPRMPLGGGGWSPVGRGGPGAKAPARGGAESAPSRLREKGAASPRCFRDLARSPWARTLGRGGTRGGKAAKAQGGDSVRRGTRATHSPPAAAPAASRRCKPASEATQPRSRRREPLAPAGPAPRTPRSIRCRRVSGLRSGESPPPAALAARGGGGAASARRKGRGRARAPATRCARPGPRPPPGGSRVTNAAPPPRRPSSAKATLRDAA